MDYLCAAYRDIFFICNPIRRVHACLALTCHLHCWQIGWEHSGNTAGGKDTDTGQQLDPGEENDPALIVQEPSGFRGRKAIGTGALTMNRA